MKAVFRNTDMVEEVLKVFFEVKNRLGDEYSREISENALSLALKLKGIKIEKEDN